MTVTTHQRPEESGHARSRGITSNQTNRRCDTCGGRRPIEEFVKNGSYRRSTCAGCRLMRPCPRCGIGHQRTGARMCDACAFRTDPATSMCPWCCRVYRPGKDSKEVVQQHNLGRCKPEPVMSFDTGDRFDTRTRLTGED